MPKAKLLVVDDEPTVLRFCTTALTLYGFELLTATNGIDALNIFEQFHPEIDLAIVDVTMPQLGGIDVARRMFELKAHPNIILMTGFTPDLIIPADLQKLCGTLTKPFATRDLLAAVEKCLKYEQRNHPN